MALISASPSFRSRHGCAPGFTLIELVIALAVASVLVSLAVPGLRGIFLDSRRSAVVTDLLWAMQLARSQTVLRAEYITVCPTSDGARCASAAADWTRGWLLYANLDRSYSGTEPDSAEPILRHFRNGYEGIRVSSGARVAFTFRPFELNSDTGTITLCDERGATQPRQRRAVIVSNTGRSRASDRQADGTDLVCP